MTYNMAKARALNQVAMALRPQLNEWAKVLRQEINAITPPKDKTGLARFTMDVPGPPELISLKTADVERLIGFLRQASDGLAKHSEMIKRG